ncbi:MAG: LpxI family protein, partial [Endomicrobiia bacterium]
MNNIGLIAGNGRFPFLVAEEIRKQGDKVITIALNEEADKDIEKVSDETVWLSVGKLQKIIDTFKEKNVNIAVMVGQVKHAKIYSAISMDFRAIKLMGSLLNKKAD